MKTTFRPLHDNILVKRQEAEKVSAGGLYIPESRQLKSLFGEVLSVGPGRFLEGSSTARRAIEVQPGQVVYFRGTSGQEIELDGEMGYVILREDEVEGVVEEP